MTDEDVKKIGKLMDVKLKGFKNVVKEEIETALEPVHQKLDALTGDVMNLQEKTKAIWDKIALGHTRNKREIDEIKRHLDLPSMADIPEV